MKLLQVNEIYGPVWQGEGPFAGQLCMFVRLYGCNLSCGYDRVGKNFVPNGGWKCDTYFTWNTTLSPKSKECHEMTASQVMNRLLELWPMDIRHTIVVVSGGEPMMQQTALSHLAMMLINIGCPVHIETAGTIMPNTVLDSYVTQYVVSPKLSNSGNLHSKRYKPRVLIALRDAGAYFKFVVSEPSDLLEVDQIVGQCNIPTNHVMIMPEGTTRYTILDNALKVSKHVLQRGYGLSLRQQTLLYEDERGR